jgi:hypothetical protein
MLKRVSKLMERPNFMVSSGFYDEDKEARMLEI